MSGIPLLGGMRTAIANVHLDGDANVVYQSNDGFSDTLTVNGTGDFTHTLSHNIATAKQCIVATLVGSGGFPSGFISYTQVSDSQIQIKVYDAGGSPSDGAGYSIMVAQKQ